jgi:hypothetical protein
VRRGIVELLGAQRYTDRRRGDGGHTINGKDDNWCLVGYVGYERSLRMNLAGGKFVEERNNTAREVSTETVFNL